MWLRKSGKTLMQIAVWLSVRKSGKACGSFWRFVGHALLSPTYILSARRHKISIKAYSYNYRNSITALPRIAGFRSSTQPTALCVKAAAMRVCLSSRIVFEHPQATPPAWLGFLFAKDRMLRRSLAETQAQGRIPRGAGFRTSAQLTLLLPAPIFLLYST
jgi:hypothetical protein